ncbi:hypothetical protein SAMN02799630_04023 [Paenibacillus sp. UNCCL117]|uniref:hypothetical protein n=1 Tax=unclassified Paenibacillus TaxID=185978 RepID=UPI00088E71E9|nr:MULTISPECIES: hypothetical protein [unclassified Paenibacillus]SDD78110.1 hypothetical protein SAMN04488602_11388 [Paenibacillus sp. cl123]SFW52897.1 hypothetical protein SAMN02799630_04023 [Paenibacillus sp. UNCCL117]
MAWKTVYETEHVTLVVDQEKSLVMMETSSGGYRPRYVTLHWSPEQLDAMIDALQLARRELAEPGLPD